MVPLFVSSLPPPSPSRERGEWYGVYIYLPPPLPAERGEWYAVGSRDAGPPNRILFVEEVTGLIAESLPELWKLGQAYISGALFQGMQMVAEREQPQMDSCSRNKPKFEVRRNFLQFLCLFSSHNV